MGYKSGSFGELFGILFGDFFLKKDIKEAFKKDEVYARTLSAFDDISVLEKKFFQIVYDKLFEIEGIEEYNRRQGKELQEEERSGLKFQFVATETHMLFMALMSIYIRQSLKSDVEKTIQVFNELFRKSFAILEEELHLYTSTKSLVGVSEVFGKRIADIFNHKDSIIISDLNKIVPDFYGLFVSVVGRAFVENKEIVIERVYRNNKRY